MARKNIRDRSALLRDKTELPKKTGVFWKQKKATPNLLDVKSALMSKKNERCPFFDKLSLFSFVVQTK